MDEFYKHPEMADGRLGKCKACTKKDVQEYYRRTFPERQKYERIRFTNPDRRKKLSEYRRVSRQRSPQKYAARAAVANAIRAGTLTRCPCEVCGDPVAQAHHEDYARPLEVRWLCRTHHHKVHGNLGHLH